MKIITMGVMRREYGLIFSTWLTSYSKIIYQVIHPSLLIGTPFLFYFLISYVELELFLFTLLFFLLFIYWFLR